MGEGVLGASPTAAERWRRLSASILRLFSSTVLSRAASYADIPFSIAIVLSCGAAGGEAICLFETSEQAAKLGGFKREATGDFFFFLKERRRGILGGGGSSWVRGQRKSTVGDHTGKMVVLDMGRAGPVTYGSHFLAWPGPNLCSKSSVSSSWSPRCWVGDSRVDWSARARQLLDRLRCCSCRSGASRRRARMRVVVTGATGYLGGRLCAALADAGHAVRAFVRRSSDSSGLPAPVELAYGDVGDAESLAAAFDGCEAVFHAAAAVEPWLPDPSVFTAVNVRGLENVLKAAKRTPTVKKIIYTSSFFAIGPTDGYVADETQMHQGKTFCTEYEKSKVLADRIALQAASEGVPITIVYPGVIYGPGKLTTGNLVSRILIERFNGRLPGYIGDGYDRESFCHVDDVVSGHIEAMEKGRVGERYLLTGENMSFKQIFDMAANITNTKSPSFHVPLWVIEIYGWISVFVSRITKKLPLISYPTVHVLRHQWAYSCDKAKRELGYSPKNLTEGLSEMLLWLKNDKLIKF